MQKNLRSGIDPPPYHYPLGIARSQIIYNKKNYTAEEMFADASKGYFFHKTSRLM